MKKYIRLAAATISLVMVFLSLPLFVKKTVTPVDLIFPDEMQVSRDIPVSGEIEEIAKKEIYVELPVVPSQIFISVGDVVERGDLLATIDTEATQALLYTMVEETSGIPEEYMEIISKVNVSSEILQQYIPTEITATASGTVTGLGCTAGNILLPKIPFCTISDLAELRVKITVPESDISEVEIGDTVLFTVAATPNTQYAGEVSTIFPTASKVLVGTSQQTMVGVYVKILSSTEKLKPGYTVEGAVKKKDAETTLLLPYESVRQDEDNREYIYLCQEGRAVRKEIQTGIELAEGIAVVGGITPDTVVVRDAAEVPREGARLCGKEG